MVCPSPLLGQNLAQAHGGCKLTPAACFFERVVPKPSSKSLMGEGFHFFAGAHVQPTFPLPHTFGSSSCIACARDVATVKNGRKPHAYRD
jgi:hypothetical protein